MLTKELGIDLGSANTAVVSRRRGLVAREPSVVAIDRETRAVLAVGTRARHMIGRTPDSIQPIQPVRGGVICDQDRTTALLRHMIQQIAQSRFLRPRLVLSARNGLGDVERRALLDAAAQAGAGELYLIDEAVAAALGAGLPVDRPTGSLVVDIGAGTTDLAVISLGAVVIAASAPTAGDLMDEAIVRQVRREHNLLIGEPTAERVKTQLGAALPLPLLAKLDPESAHRLVGQRGLVCGRQVATGLPSAIELPAESVQAAIEDVLLQIDSLVLGLLERTPPELIADIATGGIMLTGAGAQLAGLPARLGRLTGLPVRLAEAPAEAVALGTIRAMEQRGRLRLKPARR